MSEQTAPTEGTEETNGQSTDATKEFQAITSQEDFDKAIQARIARERNKFADYDDLQAKAAKFSEWEDAQKTEVQKQQEALEAAQKELAETRLQVARAEVSAAKGIPPELLADFVGTREELEAKADALIAFKVTQQSLHVPNISKVPTRPVGAESDMAFADFLTGRTN